MSNRIWERLSISAQPADKLPPEERVNSWEEVYQGLDLNRARLEAARCIHCPSTPCIEACPTHNDIPGALLLLEHGDYLAAANRFRETSSLPEMCGRLCPQERLCEGDCPVGFAIRPDGRKEPPVGIGQLEAFVTDAQREQLGGFPLPTDQPEPTGRRVAVVGSGPSGLSVAEEVVKYGHECTVIDQWPTPGGALAHGIPNFKLAKRILQQKLQYLTMIGVDFISNVKVGRDLTVDELLDQGFDAVYLGTGAGIDRELRIPGAGDFDGIMTVTDFLVRANASVGKLLAAPGDGHTAPDGSLLHRPDGPRVVVIGGGHAAMDAVRAALRLGASAVTLLFSGTADEIHARAEEEDDARAEGVVFRCQSEPVEFIGDESRILGAVRARRVEQTTTSRRGRTRTFAVAGSEFELPASVAVIALGYEPDPLVQEWTHGLSEGVQGYLHVDNTSGRTGRPGVFAGGDVVHGAGLVVTAMAAGKRAAAGIDRYLRSLSEADAQLAAFTGTVHEPRSQRARRRP